ncbi:hypothetical protein PN836_020495 [Ningiella sp. W23]|uniref:hypothetical protein n=1 Tax=Ningiella sp. W23 TaxID=3023715 RepID=UPI0037580FE7
MHKRTFTLCLLLLIFLAMPLSFVAHAQGEQNADSIQPVERAYNSQVADSMKAVEQVPPVVTVNQAMDDLPDDFQQIVVRRKNILLSINRTNSQLAMLQGDMYSYAYSSPEMLQRELDEANTRLVQNKAYITQLENRGTSLSAEEEQSIKAALSYIDIDEDSIKRLERDMRKLQEDEQRIQKLSNDLLSYENTLTAIELKLGNMFNLEKERNSFRMMTSIAFVALVAIVIVGFYIIALKKENIAESIFAGEKGIQFVTIFLIVISIILFGIMGVLESKELSALLGGLSGYILGRVSTSTDRKKDEAVQQE